MIVRAVLRMAGSIAVLVALYYLLPPDHSSTGAAVTILVIGLVLFIGLVALQVAGAVTNWADGAVAGARLPRRRSRRCDPATNEMLQLISPFREKDDRLLVCATNSVRALDTAFLRHGRFDYVLPVGPPDEDARRAIWDRYLRAIPHRELDMAAVVAQSMLFTPADIEFAARRTAQLVFERVLFEHQEELAATADVLRGIAETRRTLTQQMVADFEQDIIDFARV